MYNKAVINRVFKEMVSYYAGEPARIQHFTKVYAYAALIGELENLDVKTRCILEIAALMHDIGIKEAEQRYNSAAGKYQEELGPGIAKKLLKNLSVEEDIIERVCFLVGHHHTYTDICGMDYQILVEADFMVNMHEDNCKTDTIIQVYNKIFRTESGKKLYVDMFGIMVN